MRMMLKVMMMIMSILSLIFDKDQAGYIYMPWIMMVHYTRVCKQNKYKNKF